MATSNPSCGRTTRSRRTRRAGAPLALILVLLLAACSAGRAATPTATPRPAGFASPTGAELKIDTVLLDIYQAYKDGGAAAAEQRARETRVLTPENEVQVTLVLSDSNTQPVADKVTAQGGRVVGTADNLIDIAVPLAVIVTYAGAGGGTFLQELAAYSTVKEVRATPIARPEGLDFPADAPAEQVRASVARAVTEGVKVSGADRWHAAGFTGKGVKIGVIDGGFKDNEKLRGRELPSNLTIRAFTTNGRADNGLHGTAVAEIIHGMAPDAELFLAAISGPTGLHQAVKWLVDEQRVTLISMSMGWHDTRGDGTGVYADAVNYARSKGVLFVKSAGNEGDTHYTATFTDSDGDGVHEFAPGKEQLQVGGHLLVFFTWEAWSGAPVNYDIFLTDQAGKVLTRSANDQNAGRPPVEVIDFDAQQGQRYFVAIKAVGNARPVRIDLFGKNTPLEKIGGKSTPAGSISTPGDAKGSFTVGATDQKNDVLETYSSQGPTIDGRLKPEISGPTVVSTASYGAVGAVNQPFNGTSAAAPHVSGAAALVFGAQPGATADSVQQFLQSRAKDLLDAGPENQTGHGRLQLGEPAAVPAPAAATTTPAGPASTPRATGTPGAQTPAGAAFADPFTNPAGGLPNGGETKYESGRYVITPQGTNRAAWATYGQTYGGVTATVTVQLQGSGMAGIVFWQAGADDYYAVLVAYDGAAGYAQIARYHGGGWTSLTPWTPQPQVTPGGAVTLQLVTRGPAIQAAVNGQTLPAVQAPAAGAGKIGLVAATFAQPGAGAAFTNFAVTPAP